VRLWNDRRVNAFLQIVLRLLTDVVCLVAFSCRTRRSLEAKNFFLSRQLALYHERGIQPRRVDAATRVSLALLSRLFAWRNALVVVRPETLIGWHRAGGGCSGATSHGRDARRFLRSCANSFGAWLPRIHCGARRGLPTNYC
jgi:hypothetical protein